MTVLWRLHLRAALTDWRTILAVVGIALGTTLVVAVSVLQTETGRPFDTGATLLRSPAHGTLVQVAPDIQARLPERLTARLARISGVSLAVPVIAELTPLLSERGQTGALLFAADSCDVARVTRVNACAVAATSGGAPGPGVALSIPSQVAGALSVKPGDPIALPGGQLGDAHVGRVYAGASASDDVVVAPSLASAQALLGRAGTVTAAYVVASGAGAVGRVRHAVAGVATAGSPSPSVPTALVTVRQTLSSMRAVGIAVGAMIAIITLLLTFDARRSAIATEMLLGASTRRLVAGFAVEGAAIGAAGGLVGLLLGHLAGTFLVHQFGTALLRGTGAQLHTSFQASEIAIGLGSGIAAGVIAALLSSRGLLRQGVLANLEGQVGGVTRRAQVPLWLVPAGLLLLVMAWLILRTFGRGELPFLFGQSGIFTGVIAAIAITMALAPRAARSVSGAMANRFAVTGRSTRAEIDRLPLRTAGTVVTLALGLAIAVAFSSIANLGAATTTARFGAVEPHGFLVAAQQPWDQREGALSDATAAAVRATPGVTGVTERWRAILPSSTEPRLILGFDGPGASRMIHPVGRFRAPVADDSVALSRIASGRLHAGAGDRIELPTLTGPASFQVVGVFDPVATDDSAVGDWVLASSATARQRFGAVRSQMDVDVAPAAATAVGAALRRTGLGVVVLDATDWRRLSHAAFARWFEPFATTGYLIAIAGGFAVMNMLLLSILQRRRTRATMRTIGQTAGGERATLLAQAGVLGVFAIAFGLLWSQVFVWLLSLSSPVYYGFQLDWGVALGAVAVGTGVTVGLVALSTVAPVLAAARLDLAAALNTE